MERAYYLRPKRLRASGRYSVADEVRHYPTTNRKERKMKFTEREIFVLAILEGELEAAENQLDAAKEEEEESGDAMDSMERTHYEGVVETLEMVLALIRKGVN